MHDPFCGQRRSPVHYYQGICKRECGAQAGEYYISLESDLALSMWCARVSSESNIADAPSRNVSHELLLEDRKDHSSFEMFLSAVGISLDP